MRRGVLLVDDGEGSSRGLPGIILTSMELRSGDRRGGSNHLNLAMVPDGLRCKGRLSRRSRHTYIAGLLMDRG